MCPPRSTSYNVFILINILVNIPSTTPATEDNRTTSKIDASKTEAKIIATIEAVPLDVFERNDSTNGGNPSGKQEVEKLKTRQRSQGDYSLLLKNTF